MRMLLRPSRMRITPIIGAALLLALLLPGYARAVSVRVPSDSTPSGKGSKTLVRKAKQRPAKVKRAAPVKHGAGYWRTPTPVVGPKAGPTGRQTGSQGSAPTQSVDPAPAAAPEQQIVYDPSGFVASPVVASVAASVSSDPKIDTAVAHQAIDAVSQSELATINVIVYGADADAALIEAGATDV